MPTTNLGLGNITQGLVRFDTALETNFAILDAIHDGSTTDKVGLGSKSKSQLTFRTAGVERFKYANNIFEMLAGNTIQFSTFLGTPKFGMVRTNGVDLEFFDGTQFLSLTAGAAGGVQPSGTIEIGSTPFFSTASAIKSHIRPNSVTQILDSGTGSRTIYTCPASKKAIVSGIFHHPVATFVDYHRVLNAGSDGLTNLFASGAYNTNLFTWGTVLAAGDFIVADAASSVAITMSVVEFDDTELTDLTDLFKEDIGTTSVTLHTAATGKGAIWSRYLNVGNTLRHTIPGNDRIFGYNHTGGAINMIVVLNIGAGQIDVASISIPANSLGVSFIPYALSLKPTDALLIRSSVANSLNVSGIIQEIDVGV